ncbi:hypothetical protein CEUSTIGMA_g1.t1 [Chlamydomonas eustigma]|uniref:BRCT domain-containing protein n=1 Tax=Chlamydomonas eustigma TaxID=1157962 RepID=A0A250WNZ4_9CHLO|nr:hypothetical protein CEUSTIGMA_g1.t1 [Chlamydomonas eustigma]|eukprot:GAX72545.1 hypothetical protein CEUSTIGMA_g1.t1 [Chlamydomonas eustigma]
MFSHCGHYPDVPDDDDDDDDDLIIRLAGTVMGSSVKAVSLKWLRTCMEVQSHVPEVIISNKGLSSLLAGPFQIASVQQPALSMIKEDIDRKAIIIGVATGHKDAGCGINKMDHHPLQALAAPRRLSCDQADAGCGINNTAVPITMAIMATSRNKYPGHHSKSCSSAEEAAVPAGKAEQLFCSTDPQADKQRAASDNIQLIIGNEERGVFGCKTFVAAMPNTEAEFPSLNQPALLTHQYDIYTSAITSERQEASIVIASPQPPPARLLLPVSLPDEQMQQLHTTEQPDGSGRPSAFTKQVMLEAHHACIGAMVDQLTAAAAASADIMMMGSGTASREGKFDEHRLGRLPPSGADDGHHCVPPSGDDDGPHCVPPGADDGHHCGLLATFSKAATSNLLHSSGLVVPPAVTSNLLHSSGLVVPPATAAATGDFHNNQNPIQPEAELLKQPHKQSTSTMNDDHNSHHCTAPQLCLVIKDLIAAATMKAPFKGLHNTALCSSRTAAAAAAARNNASSDMEDPFDLPSQSPPLLRNYDTATGQPVPTSAFTACPEDDQTNQTPTMFQHIPNPNVVAPQHTLLPALPCSSTGRHPTPCSSHKRKARRPVRKLTPVKSSALHSLGANRTSRAMSDVPSEAAVEAAAGVAGGDEAASSHNSSHSTAAAHNVEQAASAAVVTAAVSSVPAEAASAAPHIVAAAPAACRASEPIAPVMKGRQDDAVASAAVTKLQCNYVVKAAVDEPGFSAAALPELITVTDQKHIAALMAHQQTSTTTADDAAGTIMPQPRQAAGIVSAKKRKLQKVVAVDVDAINTTTTIQRRHLGADTAAAAAVSIGQHVCRSEEEFGDDIIDCIDNRGSSGHGFVGTITNAALRSRSRKRIRRNPQALTGGGRLSAAAAATTAAAAAPSITEAAPRRLRLLQLVPPRDDDDTTNSTASIDQDATKQQPAAAPAVCDDYHEGSRGGGGGEVGCHNTCMIMRPAADIIHGHHYTCRQHSHQNQQVFMFSGVPARERSYLTSKLARLKATVMDGGKWTPRVTTVLTGSDSLMRRSDKLVCAMAAGCWVLNEQYILDCLQVQKSLLPPDSYELVSLCSSSTSSSTITAGQALLSVISTATDVTDAADGGTLCLSSSLSLAAVAADATAPAAADGTLSLAADATAVAPAAADGTPLSLAADATADATAPAAADGTLSLAADATARPAASVDGTTHVTHVLLSAAKATTGNTKSGTVCISSGAPGHWRRRRQALGKGAFSGLRVAIIGKLPAPMDAAACQLLLQAGGADRVVIIPTRHLTSSSRGSQQALASTLSSHNIMLAVVSPEMMTGCSNNSSRSSYSSSSTSSQNKSILSTLYHLHSVYRVWCVTSQYLVEWVAQPWSSLEPYYLALRGEITTIAISDELDALEKTRGTT